MSKPFVVLSLPIEPIERRYSSQWNAWFDAAFIRNRIPSYTVHGGYVSEPVSDKFLDPIGTFRWKFSQLNSVVRSIEDIGKDTRIVVFLHDGWMPGTEMFPYLRDMDGYDIKVVSYWHAGAYDPTDIFSIRGGRGWAFHSEWSWMGIADVMFAATKYHSDKMVPNDPSYARMKNKIEVVGSPIEVPNYDLSCPKSNIVVWPHRISEDKHPEVFDRLSKESCFEGVQFIRTMDQYRSKEEYYGLLWISKVAVSTATHENFGIAMVEAAMLGCFPVIPRGLCYDETMDSTWQYGTYEQMVNRVKRGLEMQSPYLYPFADRYSQVAVTDKVCTALRRLGEE